MHLYPSCLSRSENGVRALHGGARGQDHRLGDRRRLRRGLLAGSEQLESVVGRRWPLPNPSWRERVRHRGTDCGRRSLDAPRPFLQRPCIPSHSSERSFPAVVFGASLLSECVDGWVLGSFALLRLVRQGKSVICSLALLANFLPGWSWRPGSACRPRMMRVRDANVGGKCEGCGCGWAFRDRREKGSFFLGFFLQGEPFLSQTKPHLFRKTDAAADFGERSPVVQVERAVPDCFGCGS